MGKINQQLRLFPVLQQTRVQFPAPTLGAFQLQRLRKTPSLASKTHTDVPMCSYRHTNKNNIFEKEQHSKQSKIIKAENYFQLRRGVCNLKKPKKQRHRQGKIKETKTSCKKILSHLKCSHFKEVYNILQTHGPTKSKATVIWF